MLRLERKVSNKSPFWRRYYLKELAKDKQELVRQRWGRPFQKETE